jgi:chloramphenicol-sensitive protein RarD
MLLSSEKRYFFIGTLSGILANVLLGVSSIFWKSIGSLNAVVLVGYRIYLSLLLVFLVVCVCKDVRRFYSQLTFRLLVIHVFAAMLIAVNWGVFIWASIHGRVLESSLGYLIAPILSIATGIVVYKESVTVCKTIAVIVVMIAVVWLFVLSNELDMRVYLSIGVSWGVYSCLKKMTTLNVFSGLLLESTVLAVLYSLILFCSDLSMAIPVEFELWRTLLLFSCGVVSIVPLALFSLSAKRLSGTSMGLLQFVLPVTQFFVAIMIYKQSLSMVIMFVLLAVMSALLLVVLEPVLKIILVKNMGERHGA